MKSLRWSFKAGIFVAALIVLSSANTSGLRAQDEGVAVEGGGVCLTASCEQSSTNQCFCVKAGNCSGCYIPNGQSGCGRCTVN